MVTVKSMTVTRAESSGVKCGFSFSLFLFLPLYLCLSICLSLSPSLSLFVYLSVSLSLCISVWLSVCLSVSISLRQRGVEACLHGDGEVDDGDARGEFGGEVGVLPQLHPRRCTEQVFISTANINGPINEYHEHKRTEKSVTRR